ncbi:MAG: hypothetical protein J0I45_13015 [Bosea sp.]|nr:hypothetical protein [Bosea sp. (in: a-proteobacteria)]
MSNGSNKDKRKALPGVSLQELVDAGIVDDFYNLQDSVDMPPLRLTRHSYLPDLPKRTVETSEENDLAKTGEKLNDNP